MPSRNGLRLKLELSNKVLEVSSDEEETPNHKLKKRIFKSPVNQKVDVDSFQECTDSVDYANLLGMPSFEKKKTPRSPDWRTMNILDLPRIYAVTRKEKAYKAKPKSGSWKSLSPRHVRYDAEMTMKRLLAFDPERLKPKKEKPQSPSWKQARFSRAKVFQPIQMSQPM